MPFVRMIEEVSSILWGLSIAINIILLLIGLPLCLLICCCCRKHQSSIEKDIQSIVANHNLLGNQSTQPNQPMIQYMPAQQQEGIQVLPQQEINQNQGQSQRSKKDQFNQVQVQRESQILEGNLGENHEIKKRTYGDLNKSFTLDDNELIE